MYIKEVFRWQPFRWVHKKECVKVSAFLKYGSGKPVFYHSLETCFQQVLFNSSVTFSVLKCFCSCNFKFNTFLFFHLYHQKKLIIYEFDHSKLVQRAKTRLQKWPFTSAPKNPGLVPHDCRGHFIIILLRSFLTFWRSRFGART